MFDWCDIARPLELRAASLADLGTVLTVCTACASVGAVSCATDSGLRTWRRRQTCGFSSVDSACELLGLALVRRFDSIWCQKCTTDLHSARSGATMQSRCRLQESHMHFAFHGHSIRCRCSATDLLDHSVRCTLLRLVAVNPNPIR